MRRNGSDWLRQASGKRHLVVERLEPRHLLSAAPRINEFMAKNDGTLRDGDGVASDWLEIHNAGNEAIDLAGWHLTDDPAELEPWMFPLGRPSITVVEPGQYMLVFASGAHVGEDGRPIEPYVDAAGHLHANFRIDADGEYLALVGPQGVVSEFGTAAARFPPQYSDISYGQDQLNGGGPLFFPEPTPAAANGQGVVGVITDQVRFSQRGQTFREPFDLTLSAASGTATIRYTLDGTVPGETSTIYAGAIPITSTVQVRARVFQTNFAPGPLHSESYFQLADDVVDFTSPLPILVIENFGAGRVPNKRAHNPPAGDGGGIQQVARQFVQLGFFAGEDGSSSLRGAADLTMRAGVRVRGSSSANFRKQSLSVEAWGENDDDADIQPLGLPPESDWVLYGPSPEFDHTLLHNTFVYELSRQIGRYAVRFQFVEVFLHTDGGPLAMDDHDGVYVFMEKIKRDPNRVDIEPLSGDGTEGGWMLQSNRMQPVPVGGTEHPPNFHTKGPNRQQQGPYGRTFTGGTDRGGDDIPTGYNTFLNFESPRGEEINAAQIDAIVSWFDEFEDALYGPNFTDPETGYRAYIDVGSFIDHALLTNLVLSFDALQLSTYMFRRSENDKLELGPIWDFDRAYGADSRAANPTENLTYPQRFLWMPRLFEDPDFAQAYQDRWQELRTGAFSTANLHAIIDRQAAEITEEVASRNGTRNWPARLQAMKDWLARRAAAIDDLYLPRPQIDHAEGEVPPGSTVGLQSARGTIYYTTDGTDPRSSGGAIASHAIAAPGGISNATTLVAADAPASAIVPDQAFHDRFGMAWNGQDSAFDDSEASGWKQGRMGVGYDERDTYLPLLGLDLRTEMVDVNPSLYLRIPFSIPDALPNFSVLRLKMRYDDGFIAYLNGVEIARANAPSDATWDSAASVSHRDSEAAEFEEFDVTEHAGLLRPGQNVLAIHGMNRRASDNDLLMQAELLAGVFARTPVPVNTPISLVARTLDDGQWSGAVRGRFYTVEGDFSGDGIVDDADIDLVISQIRTGTGGGLQFDLTGDQVVDRSDVDKLVFDLLGTRYGDANLDGRFDTGDVAAVLAAGKYGTGQPAGFAEGDWNGDGYFTSEDIVVVLMAGGFVV